MRRFAAAVVIAFATAPLHADVTITSATGGKGLGQSMSGESVTYLKGTRMRQDLTVGGDALTSIIDAGTQKMISLNHKKREAVVYDMAAFSSALRQISDADIKTQLTPTGQTKTMLGQMCAEYTVSISVPMTMGNDKMEVALNGPVWIAKNAPGKADYAAFYRAAAEKGLFFGRPEAAKAQPGQARAMTTLYRAMADAGVPYATEIQIRIEGSGPMAAMMGKMGGTSMTTTVTAITTEPIAEDKFIVPAGYSTKSR